MKPDEFASCRKFLKLSQSNLANLLGTSMRSIQAYEQGWRHIPSNIEKMILYLIYQKRLGSRSVEPCWQIKKCPLHWRKNCAAYQFQAEGPCWFMNGTFCEGEKQNNWNRKMETCRTCSIFTRVMKGKGN